MKKITHTLEELEQIAQSIREDIIEMLLEAGSGHSAGPLGLADMFTALYFGVLEHDPKDPWKEDRDRLVLSAGHVCPVQYAALAHAGYFPKEELKTLRKIGTRLQGHPHVRALPGIENSSGPLGQGISQACGIALALRMKESKRYVFTIMGDGEQNEGQVWEAAMFAAKHKLYNLIGIVDRNNIQIDGYTEDVMPLENFKDKYEAFGWHVQEVNGHNIRECIAACEEAKVVYGKPSLIIAHTIPGKGVEFMERKPEWHGKPPNAEEAKKAIDDIRNVRTLGGNICSECE